MFGLLIAFYLFGQMVLCNGFERKFNIPLNGRNDYCANLLNFTSVMMENFAINVYVAESFLILCTLLPYFVYFAIVMFMKPHDCFDCFNRIPVLRYSIFQFTVYERNINREM
jgi:hypothetical protein